MSETVRITKNGIENVVPRGAYESVYKAKGWEIAAEAANPLERELRDKGITGEKQQSAYIKAKRERGKRHFDDGLLKGE